MRARSSSSRRWRAFLCIGAAGGVAAVLSTLARDRMPSRDRLTMISSPRPRGASRRSPGKGEYKWLYNFAAAEYQNRGDEFIGKLFAEGRSDHAQRILAQRVVLMRRWRSYFNRGLGGEKCSQKFEDKNLELLREQLFCSLNASMDADCEEPELYKKILKDSATEEDE